MFADCGNLVLRILHLFEFLGLSFSWRVKGMFVGGRHGLVFWLQLRTNIGDNDETTDA